MMSGIISGNLFRQLKKHILIFSCYFRLNLASALEYRASFFTQAFGMALSNSSFIFFWWIAFSQIGGAIAGYTFTDVLFIWAVTSTGFGLSHILFANVSNLTKMIVTGELDTFLLQPCNLLVNVICAKTNLSAWGDFFYGFVIMFIFYASNPAAWLWFLSGVLLCGILIAAVNLTAHTLTFYWGETSIIGQMVTEFIINFSIYPEKIYSPAIRVLMYSLIPAGFAVHIPLRLFHDFSFPLLLASLGGTFLYCAGACFIFYRGVRRYESGNVIVTRL